MRKIKSIIFLFAPLLLIDISNSKEVSPLAYTVCYFSFDLERYAPFEERTIHASRCYLITDAEFEKINSLIKASPTPDHLTQYNPSNSKVFIYSSTRKIYVDDAGIVKMEDQTFKNVGVFKMKELIQSIIKGKRALPQQKH